MKYNAKTQSNRIRKLQYFASKLSTLVAVLVWKVYLRWRRKPFRKCDSRQRQTRTMPKI